MKKYIYRDSKGKFRSCFYGPAIHLGLLSNQVPDDVRELYEAAHTLARKANDLLVALAEADEPDPYMAKQIDDYIRTVIDVRAAKPPTWELTYVFNITPVQAARALKKVKVTT